MARAARNNKQTQPPTYQSTLERHPEYVQALGMITVELANLEIALADLLGAILDVPREVSEAIYFTPRATIGRVEILRNVVAVMVPDNDPTRKDIEQLLNRSKRVMEKRHTFTEHGASMPEPAKSRRLSCQ